MSNCDIINQPIKFLGATVLSCNTSLGIGANESSLKVELIEDCEAGDLFLPSFGQISVGAPVYFSAGAFSFGGVLQSWTMNKSGSGQTFSVNVTDPRQLLENTVIIIDSYLGPPTNGINYFNVYGFIEGQVLEADCTKFGVSNSTDKGMPYVNMLEILKQMEPTIYSPTGYEYSINFNSFPSEVPSYYRIPGPSITILELLTNICDILGLDFYVDLLPGDQINIGTIDLKQPPADLSVFFSSYLIPGGPNYGTATEISYGQELRNEITKTVIFGEKQHYLSLVNQFDHFFGFDIVNGKYVPIIPVDRDDCGFWILKNIESLNLSLSKPFESNGPFYIHELDIRSAMSSTELWLSRVFSKEFNENKYAGSLNHLLCKEFPDAVGSVAAAINQLKQAAAAPPQNPQGNQQPPAGQAAAIAARLPDKALQPVRDKIKEQYDINLLETIHNWVRNLGTTYYGKQFIAPLKEKLCFSDRENERFFSSVPTNDGGWVDYGTTVLGLADPELGAFRSDDDRIQCFTLFNNSGEADVKDGKVGQEEPSAGNNSTPPSPPQ